jgi:hypothetical protein
MRVYKEDEGGEKETKPCGTGGGNIARAPVACSCCRAHVEVLNLTLMFLLQVASLVCLRGLRKRLRSWSCSSSWRNSLPER